MDLREYFYQPLLLGGLIMFTASLIGKFGTDLIMWRSYGFYVPLFMLLIYLQYKTTNKAYYKVKFMIENKEINNNE